MMSRRLFICDEQQHVCICQLSLKQSTLIVGTAAVLFSFGVAAHAQFNPTAHVPPWVGLVDKAYIFQLAAG